MTKEEYLNMYKEDKLAEICAQFEEERDYYHNEMNAYKSDAQSAQKKVTELSSYWEDNDKLLEKLKSIPAKDFIKLYVFWRAFFLIFVAMIPYNQRCIFMRFYRISMHYRKFKDAFAPLTRLKSLTLR